MQLDSHKVTAMQEQQASHNDTLVGVAVEHEQVVEQVVEHKEYTEAEIDAIEVNDIDEIIAGADEQEQADLASPGLVVTDLRDKRDADKNYIYTRVQYEQKALAYYLVPELALLIPKCRQSHEVLLQACLQAHNPAMSQDLVDYPVVTHPQALMHFSHYTVESVLRKVKFSKPRVVRSNYDADIRKRQQRVHAEQQAEANRQHRIAQKAKRSISLDGLGIFDNITGGTK